MELELLRLALRTTPPFPTSEALLVAWIHWIVLVRHHHRQATWAQVHPWTHEPNEWQWVPLFSARRLSVAASPASHRLDRFKISRRLCTRSRTAAAVTATAVTTTATTTTTTTTATATSSIRGSQPATLCGGLLLWD